MNQNERIEYVKYRLDSADNTFDAAKVFRLLCSKCPIGFLLVEQ